MERVEGEPVDRWCERRRTGLHERLRLFLDVCTAVQYAHGQLVVHRDIKPSNILVDAEGRVRLLDFGIARALDDAEATRTQGLALTPAYAAPEQLRGAPASVAGDVWSLGVLLYRLLAGRLPFARDDGSPADLEAILRTDPQPPSRAVAAGGPVAARSLRGATDAIVARAMMKEPGRRYPSVDALAEDIRRHLAAQPVHARRGAWTYRTGRFLRRYRLPVTIAAVAVLALSVAVWQALSAAQRARLEAQRASLVKDFLLGLFELGDPDRSGQGRVDAGTLLRLGADRALGNFSGDPQLQVDLARSIAQLAGTLGDYAQGLRALDAALGQVDSLDARARAGLLLERAFLHIQAGAPAAARADLDAVAALAGGLRDADGLQARRWLLQARLHQAAGDFDAARADITRALDLDRGGGGDGEAVARDLLELAELEFAAGNREDARRLWRELLASETARLGTQHSRIADIEHSLGTVAAEMGEHAEAEAHFQRAAALQEALLGPGHPLLARTLRNWGGNRRLAGDDGTAEALYRRALDIFEEVLGPEHPGHAYNSLGVLLANRGDLLAARDMMLRARRAFLARQADSPVLATLELNLAAIAARYGAWEAAQEGYDAALRRLRELFGEQHPQVGAAYMGLARLAVAAGEPGQALAHLQRAGAIHDAVFPGEHQERLIAGLGRARALLMLSRVTEAAAVIDDLAVRMQAALPPSHPLQLDLATVQAERLLLEGRAAAAAERLDPVLDARRAQAATAPVSLADTLLLMTRIELARGRRDQARLLLDELQAATAQVRLPPAAAAQYARLHSRLH